MKPPGVFLEPRAPFRSLRTSFLYPRARFWSLQARLWRPLAPVFRLGFGNFLSPNKKVAKRQTIPTTIFEPWALFWSFRAAVWSLLASFGDLRASFGAFGANANATNAKDQLTNQPVHQFTINIFHPYFCWTLGIEGVYIQGQGRYNNRATPET